LKLRIFEIEMRVKKRITMGLYFAGVRFFLPVITSLLLDFYQYLFCADCEKFEHLSTFFENFPRHLLMSVVVGFIAFIATFLVWRIVTPDHELSSKTQGKGRLK
jgi:hypothetical protein